MRSENQLKRLLQLVVTGVDRSRTRYALALAVGFGAGTAVLRLYAPGTPAGDLVFGFLHAFTLEANPAAMAVEGVGVVTLFALAGIHAYLNEGYIPSLVVASAPSYGQYVFNGPGPAPVWAVEYVLPFALTAGTLGFLVGFAVRRYRGDGEMPLVGASHPG